jgi:hypothetical protein
VNREGFETVFSKLIVNANIDSVKRLPVAGSLESEEGGALGLTQSPGARHPVPERRQRVGCAGSHTRSRIRLQQPFTTRLDRSLHSLGSGIRGPILSLRPLHFPGRITASLDFSSVATR